MLTAACYICGIMWARIGHCYMLVDWLLNVRFGTVEGAILGAPYWERLRRGHPRNGHTAQVRTKVDNKSYPI